MPNRATLYNQVHQDLISETFQFLRSDVSFDLGVLRETIEHAVLALEVCLVLDESIGLEHWYVVRPSVRWRCRQQDPSVVLGDLVERLDPLSTPDKVLLIENEEAPHDVDVLLDVVPAVDRHSNLTRLVLADGEFRQFLFPFQRITLLGGGDDEQRGGFVVLQVVHD